MSRTYRRKNYEDTKGASWDRRGRKTAGYYTYCDYVYGEKYVAYHPRVGEYITRDWWYEYRPMTKDEIKWQFLSDHGETNSHWLRDNPGPYIRRLCQKHQRQRSRRELQKFMINEEYEPMVEHRRDKRWWYWY